MKELRDLIKRVEAEINETPSGNLRNLLCDANILLQKQALILPIVSQRSELLKALIDTDIDVDLVSGRKCRLLKHTEESFLIQYNHNDQIEWVGISELNTKSL